MPKKRGKKVAERVYWTPPVKLQGESPVSKKKEKKKREFYVVPTTPQEAIERGIIPAEARKPRDFIPHWKRLGPSHKPKFWFCYWGCEGVQLVELFSKPTHDYYCPYWEMLLLFPECEKDFTYELTMRPPRPPFSPALNEKETARRIAEIAERKKQLAAAKEGIKREYVRNPYNIGDSDEIETIIVSKRNLSSGNSRNSTSSTRTKTSSGPASSKQDTDDGYSFSEPKPIKKRRS